MIEHIVLLRLKQGVDAAPLAAALEALPARIDVIRDFAFGPNTSDRGGGYTHALISRFDSAEDLATYIAHPAHVSAAEEHIQPNVDGVLVADVDRGDADFRG